MFLYIYVLYIRISHFIRLVHARWIDRIDARYKKGLYPSKIIVYQGKLFGSGEELRKEFPAMPCLL